MFVQSATVLALMMPAWLPTGLKWDQAEWPTVPYCITTNATRTNVNAAGLRAAVEGGIDSWVSTGAGGTLSCTTYRAAPTTSNCRTVRDINDRGFNLFWESSWSNGGSTIGVTWSAQNGRNCGSVRDDTNTNHSLRCVYDSDIEFNDRDFFWTNTGASGTDIESIAAHEYGHFIGMDHCSENGTCGQGQAVMFAAYIGGNQRTLRNDDVQGGCALYPGQQGGFAWPCTNSGQCNSGVCANAGPDGYCSQTCGSCPTGFLCEPDPAQPARDICLRDDGLNKDVCEQCQTGVQNACRNNGLCFSGIPDARCVELCSNGTCSDNRFNCVNINVGGQTNGYCLPRSSNCNDLNNFMQLQQGQPCSANGAPCASGLTCRGICTTSCDNGLMCPATYGCLELNDNTSWCYPAVNEGQDCSGLKACAVGPCLINPASNIATCYQDCEGNPGVCNNAQMCNTYSLQGGGSVSICEPPGVPPNPPDAGVPMDTGTPVDTGVMPPMDTGVMPPMDAGVPVDTGVACACDISFNCEANCACDTDCNNNQCACNTSSACEANCACDTDCNNNQCACDTDPNACDEGCFCDTACGPCACDNTLCCDTDPAGGNCACDPECNSSACACDATFGCDANCECDPECIPGCQESSCSVTARVETPEERSSGGLWALLVVGLGLWVRRRRIDV